MTIRCRFCHSDGGTVVVNLGNQPGSESFPPAGAPTPDALYPLRLWLCAVCGLAQLADDVAAPEDPQGTQPDALARQAADAVQWLCSSGVLPAAGTVIEFESPHGGSWLPLMIERGLTAAARGDQADVVLDCCFGLMHAADQATALRERVAAVRPGGFLVVEFQSLASMLEHGEWNAIRHGHHAYYSVPAMRRMLIASGMTPVTAAWFPLYGGTVAMVARKGSAEPVAALRDLEDREVDAGVLDAAAVARLNDAVDVSAKALIEWLQAQAGAGRRTYGYSAASRAVALLCSAGVDRSLLAAVADVSPAKHGARMPGTDIPVIDPADLVAARPDSVLLFVPDLLQEVRRALPDIESGGGRWVVMGAAGVLADESR